MRHALLAATLAVTVLPLGAPVVAQTGRQIVTHVLEEPGWVGITPDSVNPLTIGLVAAGTPAAAAGLLPGDRIVSIDGSQATSRSLYHRQFPIGQVVQMSFVRGTRRLGTFTFEAVENPYAAYLAAQAREDSVMREASVYRLELARSAAAPVGVDTGRVMSTSGYIRRRGTAEGADRPREQPLVILDGKIAGASIVSRAPVGAGTGTIVGRLIDGNRGTALQSVSVSVVGTSFGVVSGADGRYSISRVPEGIHTVEAARIGYARERAGSISVVAGGETTVDFVMQPQTLQLRRIVVAGSEDPTRGARPTTVPPAPPVVSPETPTLPSRRLSEGGTVVSGATLELLNPTLGEYFGAQEGVFVLRVASQSPAATAGLQPGDVIETVNGRRVLTLDAVTNAVADARGAITLSVLRRGQRVVVPLRR